MKTEAVNTMEMEPGTPLENAHLRLGQIARRRDELRRALEAARTKESELAVGLDAAKEGLVAGDRGTADVVAGDRKLQEHRTGIHHLEDALQKIDAEHSRVGAIVMERERALDRERDEKAAGPLRQEAEALELQFIEGIVNLLAPLLERAAIARKVASKYPLARPIEPVTLDSLAVALRAAMRLDDRVQHFEIVAFVRKTIAGPGGVWNADRAQAVLGLIEKR